MGLCTFQSPFDKVHGKVVGAGGVNGVVAMTSRRGANMFRTYVVPSNPQTTAQAAARSRLAQCSAAYKALTAAQAAIWDETANLINRENILGLTYYLTGIGLFNMVNTWRLVDAQTINDDMPTIEAPVKPVGITSVTLTNATTLTVVADFSGNADGRFGVARVSDPLPGESRQARANEVKMLDPTLANNVVAVSSSSVTFSLTITSGAYSAGDRIGIELIPLSDEYVPGAKTLIGNVEIASP